MPSPAVPKSRDAFASTLGAFAATVGSAVGVGSIWKFPCLTGSDGGAALVLAYLLAATLLAGLASFPAVCASGGTPAVGPGLICNTVPLIFGRRPGGAVFTASFFLLAAIGAIGAGSILLILLSGLGIVRMA